MKCDFWAIRLYFAALNVINDAIIGYNGHVSWLFIAFCSPNTAWFGVGGGRRKINHCDLFGLWLCWTVNGVSVMTLIGVSAPAKYSDAGLTDIVFSPPRVTLFNRGKPRRRAL